MFDALRRAESERRRKQSGDPQPPSLEAVASRVREAPAPIAPPRAPRPAPPATAPAAPAAPAEIRPAVFEGDMVRELGLLRNSLESRLERKSGRVLLFTSSMHGEGTTTLAIAYARLLAMHADHRVLLVELNARTPAVAERLALHGGEGLTELFSSRRPLGALVQRPEGEAFDVVHVGTPDATRIQINLEREFPRLMEDALQTWDTVIIDAPPVVLSPKTPPLAPLVDGVVLVIHSGRTKRETVDRSIKQIQQFQGRVLGVVLNRKRHYIPGFIYRRL